MDKDFKRQFTKCPCCGSEDRFLERLGDELKARGLAREEWKFHLDVKQGVVIDQAKTAAIPIGSEIPGYGFMTDICMNCGCVYATDLTRSDVKKTAAPTQILSPSRAQWHRDAREGEGLINPFSSS